MDHQRYTVVIHLETSVCACWKADLTRRVQEKPIDYALLFTVRNSSYGKVMFSQVSVCPQRGVYTPLLGRYPTGQTAPPDRNPPMGRHPLPQADGHCSGRYAFYWNAFLFSTLFPSLQLCLFTIVITVMLIRDKR